MRAQNETEVEIALRNVAFGAERRRAVAFLGFGETALLGQNPTEENITRGMIGVGFDASFVPGPGAFKLALEEEKVP